MNNFVYEIDIPPVTLKKLEDLSKNGEKTFMEDLSIVEDQENIKLYLKDFININSFHYANLFNHKNPFTIHSDISYKKKSILLIPIKAHKDQKFILFDQIVESDKEVSWIYNIFKDKTDQELKDMYYESALRTRPCETQCVKGCTGFPIDEELFKFLPYTKELYFGLTGFSWDYKPGKALLFPANRLHATGKMKSKKIGCTVQFTESINNLGILTEKHILS